jgi:hypothetical protein
VTDWHESPLANRRVFRLSYRSAKRAGALGTVNTKLTGDHEVLPDKGWVAAQDLVPGTLVATGQGLSDLARDVVCGIVLGGAHLHKAGSHLSSTHCLQQASYATWTASLLAELEPVVNVRIVQDLPGPRREVVMMRTRASRALRTIGSDFYGRPGGDKRVPSWIADVLNARMLAFWYMDAAHLRVRPHRQPSAEIATGCFDDDGLGVLVAGLDRLGLPTKVIRDRIQFDVEATRSLSTLVAPYVPPVMRYKLHPEVEPNLPFDVTQFHPGPPRVMYDEVDIEEVEFRGADKTFFCIDVDETHNFVTAGGVVHNCRPPGNRDPLPDEIDACRPYLDAQLEHIDPAVVITLGNFATRTLLGTSEGITKLRGKAYPFRNGLLVPTFHPAAALRGGGEVLAQMRADFVRAKQLVAEAAR